MKSFKVADFKAPLQEFDEATPQPSGTQVLIKVKAAGVCHSDLHIWEGGYDLGHGRKPLSLKDRGINLPLTMGHETVGEILAFGPDVKPTDQGDLKLGDVGLVYPWIGCGKCATCLGGDENMCLTPRSLGVYCDGGYSDHMLVPHPRYLLNLRGLDPASAAPYACSGVTTYSALKKIEQHFETPIVMFGAGGLGLMALSLLKAMGGKGAIMVDIDAKKREAAEKAGALATVDPKAPDALEQLAKKAGGPIRAVLDLVGNAATTQLGFDCLTKGGKLVIVGPVRRRRDLGAAADSDQGGDDPGQLCRKPARDAGAARPGANEERSADPGDAAAAQQSQRRAGAVAAGRGRRAHGADAVIATLSVVIASEAKQSRLRPRMHFWIASSQKLLAMTSLSLSFIRKSDVRKQRLPHCRARR
ncbi:D-arabinose 1-dehydrogenase-like Zn-dependent alcohol dehydrogenase [Bradyrhizobium sp. LB1.3]